MPTDKEIEFAALQKGDFAGAIPALVNAITADPNDFDAHIYLGAAYSQTDKHTEAVETLTKAVYLQPENAQVRYNLGVAFERAGWTEQAVEVMQQVLQLQPNYAQAQQALQRLQPSQVPVLPTMPVATPNNVPGYAPPTQANIPGYAPPTQANIPSYAPPTNAQQTPTPQGQTFQGLGAPQSFPPPQQPLTGYGSQQMPNPAPQPIYAPTPAPSVKTTSIAVGILALTGIAIGTGVGLGFITLAIASRLPLGILTGWTTGKAAKFFAGGATVATGVIAAIFSALTSASYILTLYLMGYPNPTASLYSAFIAMWWAYSVANERKGAH